MSEFIYNLLDGGAIFYVGRSKDPATREKEHRREGALNRGTRKYEYIFNLFESGKDFEMEIIREIPEGEYPYDYEDFYVLKAYHNNNPIQNMKHGDLALRKRLGDDYKKIQFRNVDDLRVHRLEEKEKAEKRQRTLKEELDNLSTPEREARNAKRYWNRILRLTPVEVIEQYEGMSRAIMVDLRDVCQDRVKKNKQWEEVLCVLFFDDFNMLVDEFTEMVKKPINLHYHQVFFNVCSLVETREAALHLAHGGHDETLLFMDDIIEEKSALLSSMKETS